MRSSLTGVILTALVVGCGPEDGATGPGPTLTVAEVVSGLSGPTYLTAPAGDARMFVTEQPGRIRIIAGDTLVTEPFLDIVSKVGSGGERGLLSMAFHPDYAANGHFYVNYTNTAGDTRVERYSVSANPARANPASATLILEVAQPFANHNGGQIAFGPDGMLYVGMGDGGSGGDPQNHGQDVGTLLGALLRIDVDGGDPYAVPSDNPFAGDPNAAAEIWAYGLRNPWRFSFDPPSGNLFIADVGQNAWEEINGAPADGPGRNYGWNVMEGFHCFSFPGCNRTGLTLPLLEYDNGGTGCSVVGGFVYRGAAIPDLQGHYFYSDFCAGFLRTFTIRGGLVADHTDWQIDDIGRVLSFGQDAAGELYMLVQTGRVYRIAARNQ